MSPSQRKNMESLLPWKHMHVPHEKEAAKPTPTPTKPAFVNGDYPTEWSEFIGQVPAVRQLKVAIASAVARDVRLDHILLASGAHGIGKTTLGQIVACQMGTGFKAVSGPLSIDDARSVLGRMRDKDILFWDEFHLAVQGNKSRADWMLPFLTDSVLLTNTGSVRMPQVTVIAATTDAGKLPQTITSRFMLRPRLDMYTDEEAIAICRKLSQRMGVAVDAVDYPAIVRAANNNPRDMRMVLTSLRDQVAAIGDYDLRLSFEWAGLTEDGLTREALEIMQVLYIEPKRTMSIESIQATLNEPGPLRHHEQILIQRGYVLVTGRGRMLTEAGAARVEEQ
jgi:Holliday junction DNA helicase RuvB